MIRERPRTWLRPVGAAFGAVARLRAAAYARGWRHIDTLRGPVVSVGNLSVGGSGKTPVVARLARMLTEAGVSAAILSRGYRGRHAGPSLLVSDGVSVLASAADAGDEPVMLARALPGVVVAVGRRRFDAGQLVEARFGPRVHLLDDGFQHLRLRRDLDLICVAERDVHDAPLPCGRLREALDSAARADFVLFDGTPGTLESLRTRLGRDRVLTVRRAPAGFTDVNGAAVPPPRRAYLLSGIARPERFAADVAGQCEVVGSSIFGDHHAFRSGELQQVQGRARLRDADAVVTTAKDAVRLAPQVGSPPVVVYHTCTVIEGDDALRTRLIDLARRIA